MNNLLVIGWYQIYEIEREQHEDELTKIRVEVKRQEQYKSAELQARIEKGQCDD